MSTTTESPIELNAIQARICLSPAELELWREEYRSRMALGSSVRDAERFATQCVMENRRALVTGASGTEM